MLLTATKAELKKQTKILTSMNEEDKYETANRKSDNPEKNNDSSNDSDSSESNDKVE